MSVPFITLLKPIILLSFNPGFPHPLWLPVQRSCSKQHLLSERVSGVLAVLKSSKISRLNKAAAAAADSEPPPPGPGSVRFQRGASEPHATSIAMDIAWR